MREIDFFFYILYIIDSMKRLMFGLLVIVTVVGSAGCIREASDTGSSGSVSGYTTKDVQGGRVSELKKEDSVVGTGDEAISGKEVTVQYVGTLTDGTKFDSSVDHGKPFTFTLGSGQVIKGWDQGVLGMKVGGKRKLTIPSELGYGARGAGGVIPPNATLVFEIELLGVK